MKQLIILSIILIGTLSVSAQDIAGFVNRQMETYPESRLLDIYKSCFQDFMGAEHLVSDRQRVKAYLDEELNTTSLDELMPWSYEPCGIDSNYYRVSIRTIKEDVISEDLLLDAFIRSSNSSKHPTLESWRDRWHLIIGKIDLMQIEVPHYQQDKDFIDSILSAGKYAISHSTEYRETYRPHYRIVERSIFEREIKPLIETKHLQNQSNDMDDKKQLTNEAIAEGKHAYTMSCKGEKDESQIEVLYNQMYQAMIAKDIAALDTILAEKSVLIHMTGVRQSKNEYLHEIENGTLNYYSVEDDGISISVNGTTAEMTGRSRVNAAVYGGDRHTWRLQIKSRLVKTDGRWQFIESRVSTY